MQDFVKSIVAHLYQQLVDVIPWWSCVASFHVVSQVGNVVLEAGIPCNSSWSCCAWEALLWQEIMWLLNPFQNWEQKRYKLSKHRSWTPSSFQISHFISQFATVAQSLARSPRKCVCIRCRRFESPSQQSHTEFSHSLPSFCLN